MKTILKILGGLIGLVLVLAIALVTWLSLREYRPEAEEIVEIKGSGNSLLKAGDSLSLVTCNIGYGGLDAEHDFLWTAVAMCGSNPGGLRSATWKGSGVCSRKRRGIFTFYRKWISTPNVLMV